MAKIVTGVFDGDADALFALMIDSSIDEFVREVLFGAVTFLAWERHIDRDRLQKFLVRFYESRPAEDGDQAWADWLQAIALLGLRDWRRWSTRPTAKTASPRSGSSPRVR